jgi:L-ascorbate peroxidase
MQWGQFDKLLGRADAAEADPEGRVPVWGTASTAEIKERFAKLGIKPRQVS